MRHFLLLTMLLTIGCVRVARAEQLVILSLGADQKIAVYSLNASDGTIAPESSVSTAGKPGAMCVSRDGGRLYVAVKGTGSIASYRIGDGGQLRLMNETIVGADPSYLSLDRSGRYLMSAYYSAGKAAVHSIASDGTVSAKPLQMFGTDERAHAAVFDRSGTFAFVPHTRPNAIFQFRFDDSTGNLSPNDPPKLRRRADTGPRHLWFHPGNRFAYGSDEQGSSVTAYRFDDHAGQLTTMETLSSLPDGGFDGKNSTSDIEVHPSGKFVYIANRGHDTIAGYSIHAESGGMTLLGHTPTESVTRSFNISPDGRHLIAAGQKSGKLAVFRIAEDGTLLRNQTLTAGKNPWWVQIVDR